MTPTSTSIGNSPRHQFRSNRCSGRRATRDDYLKIFLASLHATPWSTANSTACLSNKFEPALYDKCRHRSRGWALDPAQARLRTLA